MIRFELDPRWSDTGDRYVSFHIHPGFISVPMDPCGLRSPREEERLIVRYILKLFRDFVFHSIGVDNAPVLDLSHVLTCLNKVRSPLTSHHQDRSSSLMIA